MLLRKFCPKKFDVPACKAFPSCIKASSTISYLKAPANRFSLSGFRSFDYGHAIKSSAKLHAVVPPSLLCFTNASAFRGMCRMASAHKISALRKNNRGAHFPIEPHWPICLLKNWQNALYD